MFHLFCEHVTCFLCFLNTFEWTSFLSYDITTKFTERLLTLNLTMSMLVLCVSLLLVGIIDISVKMLSCCVFGVFSGHCGLLLPCLETTAIYVRTSSVGLFCPGYFMK
jgi:hypothetical protein